MLYAWVGDQKRAPVAKGERTTCRDCGGPLTAVMPVEKTPHWWALLQQGEHFLADPVPFIAR